MNKPSAVLLAVTAGCALGAAPGHFTAPMQPWRIPDGRVRLLRPAAAHVEQKIGPINTLMRPGWRLFWGEGESGPGAVIVRLSIEVHPEAPVKTEVELLQVGASRDPHALAGCLLDGLTGFGERRPDRVINGVRYRVWQNSDAGMSQFIRATDLRAVVDGTCYAVERFSVGESASDGHPGVTLPESKGAALLDAALASLRIGDPGALPAPVPPARLPPGAVAR